MTYRPGVNFTDVQLASGTILKVPVCPKCQKLEISAKDEAKLRREKVQLGRCRCTPKEKGAAGGPA